MTDDTPINPGEVAGRLSAYYGVFSGDPRIQKLMEMVYPEIEQAAVRDPLSWASALPGVMAKYDSLARDLGLGVAPKQLEAQRLDQTGSNAAGLAGVWGGVGATGLRFVALQGDQDERGASGRSAGLGAEGAISLAKELGMSPGMAAYFAGASSAMCGALKEFVAHGTAIRDEQVQNLADVTSVIALVKDGKLKPDDPRIPPSVREIMSRMKAEGVDPATADAGAIRRYFREHPQALEEVKRDRERYVAATAHLTDAQLKAATLDKKVAVAAASTSAKGSPQPEVSKLNLT